MSPTSNIPSSNIPFASSSRRKEDIFEYITVIMRRWKIFALALCSVLIIVAFNTFTMKPIYEATATIRIKENTNLMQTTQQFWYDPAMLMNTEIAIMKSRSIAEQVAEQLHLNWQVSNKSAGLSLKILEFTSTAKDPSYKIKLTAADKFEVQDEKGNIIGQGQSGILMKKNGLSMLINDINGKTGDSFQLNLVSLVNASAQVQGGFNASEYGKQTNIIRTSYQSTDPVLARDMVNAFVQVYIEHAVDVRTEETKKTVSFIDDQIKALRGDLDSSEKNLQSYKSGTGVVKLDNEAESLITKISEMEKNRTEITLQKQQLEFARDALKKAIAKGTTYSPGIMKNDQLVGGLATKLYELEMQKKALLANYTEAHQAVKNTQNQIEEIQNKMLAVYETSLTNLAKQKQDISQQLSVYDGQIRKLPNVERDLAHLTRVSKVNSDIYTFLLQKHEEASIARASTISNINIVDLAITPQSPIKPDKRKNLLLGLIVGLALGIGLAFFQEYLDDTIKNADEAKRAIGLPVLAIIPEIAPHKPKQDGSLPANETLITQSEPKSVASEAFRSLRTNLHFSAINKKKKIMIFTSTFPKEGKSFISSNVAVVSSQTGARVLIVDCDLRRSSLHQIFGHSKTPGLSELLTKDVTFEEAKHNTNIPGLDLITAGTSPPNPSELLGSEAMHQFLTSQQENYDYIIIDAPPVLAVTDAPVLTTISDIVILIMEAGRVPIKAAQYMRATLDSLNAPLSGLVINDKTGKGESYSYYDSSYYRYGRGYRYGKGYGYGYGYGYYANGESKHHIRVHPWEKYLKFLPDKWRNELKKYLPR